MRERGCGLAVSTHAFNSRYPCSNPDDAIALKKVHNQMKERSVVVVKWSERSPSIPASPVQILIMPIY